MFPTMINDTSAFTPTPRPSTIVSDDNDDTASYVPLRTQLTSLFGTALKELVFNDENHSLLFDSADVNYQVRARNKKSI